jgi:Ca2+-binding RTX toxin-like protein
MPHVRSARAITIAFIAVAAALALAPTAQADTTKPVWKCRASAGYTVVDGGDRVETVVANGNVNTANGADPDHPLCASGEAGEGNLPAPLGIPSDLLSAPTASAITAIAPQLGAAYTQQISASGRVDNLTLRLPQGATVTVGATVAESQATGACANGVARLDGSSRVTGLTLGGSVIDANALGPALARALSSLAPTVTTTADEVVRTPDSLTVRALHIVVKQGGRVVVDAVLAESKVGFDGDVCSPLESVAFCPEGTLYSPPRNLCVIPAGQDGSSLGEIVVGTPGSSPQGGRMIALDVARKKYGNAHCLSGSSPKFVQVDVHNRNRMTGSNSADRMLGLGGNDRMDGVGGNDCMDGGSGADNMLGAVGNDQLYGVSGADNLNGGPGNDYLDGGSGDDTINASFGADRAFGGPGRDYINIATAGPPAHADCGSGRDKVRFNNNERHNLRACETRYPLKDR